MGSPEFFQSTPYVAQFTNEKRISDAKNGEHFAIDDLLDLPNNDIMADDDSGLHDANNGNSATSSIATTEYSLLPTADSQLHAGGTRNLADGQFCGELCIPNDDLAELEWLSNFEEESFSSEDLKKLQLIQGIHARNDVASEQNQYQCQAIPSGPGPDFRSQIPVPAKARSKRSRAAPGNWTSRLLMVSPNPTPTGLPAISSSPVEADISVVAKKAPQKKKESGSDSSGGGEGRRCLHCATDKTPQWRTGPLGPKTLCNACGVRYKSGRLVPEYRPASSPTFVLTKHSNSHRKVMELRRQKEMMRSQQHQQQQFIQQHHQNMMFDVSNGGNEYLIHQHIGPDFRQLI